MANYLSGLTDLSDPSQYIQTPQTSALSQYTPQFQQFADIGSALTRFGGMIQQQNNPEWAKIAADKQAQASGLNSPSAIQEYAYWKNLPADEQANYLKVKRAQQQVDLGGAVAQRDPTTGQLINVVQKTVTPDNQPVNAAATANAKATGTAVGTEAGGAQAALAAQSAQLPNLENVVAKLSDLGKKATYTKAGNIADEIVRQTGPITGVDATEGAKAKTAYMATVDNEVLPLLRQTFGAQFTAREGDTLRSTLGDPDKSSVEKDAALNSFITQKRNQVSALQRQISNPTGGIVNNAAAQITPAQAQAELARRKNASK